MDTTVLPTHTLRLTFAPHVLHFKRPAGTSRGVYLDRRLWLITAEDTRTGRRGQGECAPLPNLSCDDLPDYEAILERTCRRVEAEGCIPYEDLRAYPSILFGLETAFLHLASGSPAFWDTPFSRGEAGIPINGLIWMGSYEDMFAQIQRKMEAGFRCIKLKIGAIGFDEELALLRYIRERVSKQDVELRVDANGAFSPRDAQHKLEQLSALDLHSIEQPIRAGQWEEMARLCASSPLDIALDEELIGVNDPAEKRRLLDTIRPRYIILKPSLHGGLAGASEWIRLAEERGIGWWVTSALESNIGLNAIAQWCATLGSPMPQGLGTGALYTENFPRPLAVRRDCLWFDPIHI